MVLPLSLQEALAAVSAIAMQVNEAVKEQETSGRFEHNTIKVRLVLDPQFPSVFFPSSADGNGNPLTPLPPCLLDRLCALQARFNHETQLLQPGRSLLKHGILYYKGQNEGSYREVEAILLSDTFLVAQPGKSPRERGE